MNIKEILDNHKKWLNDEEGGIRADLYEADLCGANLREANLREANLRGANLYGADLREADLRGANLFGANLREADLREADLCGADLRGANLYGANLREADLCEANLCGANLCGADLREADLRGANLFGANLREADLRGANLCGANLRGANLCETDLSMAENLLSAITYIKDNFETTDKGIIAYKTFGSQYSPPEKWVIQSGSIITENCNMNRTDACGCGINVAPIKWVRRNYNGDIWKVLIRWEWLCGVCVPYNTDGKIRCEMVELLEIIETN